jgi:hypothetical protein
MVLFLSPRKSALYFLILFEMKLKFFWKEPEYKVYCRAEIQNSSLL